MASDRVAVVQVPAFDEPEMQPVLEAVADQREPEGWTVRREVYITPTTELPEGDTTFQVAADHAAFDEYLAPPGKVSTRNLAHNAAAASGADVVVAWDADARPVDREVLTRLLEPFSESGVVAVNGSPRPPLTNPVNLVVAGLVEVDEVIRPHMNGQLSAITTSAWEQVGPFQTGIDETDVQSVRQVEEFDFRAGLEAIGEVRRQRGAVVIENPRRAAFRIRRAFGRFGAYPMSPWDRQRGMESFEPDRQETRQND